MPQDLDCARVLVNQSHQDAQGCRLACPIGPNEPHDASRRQLEIDAVKREVFVSLGNFRKFDGEVDHDASVSNCMAIARSLSAISSSESPSSTPNRATWRRCS